MVTGNGMVAQAFANYREDDRFVIFASGVSNSKTTSSPAYEREASLLSATLQANRNKTIVYFSTCSLYDPDEKNSPYILHKKEMEAVIRNSGLPYYLFRVSNLVGYSNNLNTILNFFMYHIQKKINFDLWMNATRNLLDIEDMFTIVDTLLHTKEFINRETNIASPYSYPVKDIVAAVEHFLGIQANYIPVQKGSHFPIDISAIQPVIKEKGILSEPDYLAKLLHKYYSNK